MTFVFLENDKNLNKHLRTLAEEIDGAFGDGAEIVLLRPHMDTLTDAIEEYCSEIINIGSRGFCAGLIDKFKTAKDNQAPCSVPTKDGAPYLSLIHI